jgi:signal transduction histidine kinase
MTTEDRLEALLASAERMAGGDVEHRAEISPAHDELDALALALNVLVGELSYAALKLERAKHDAEMRSAELAAAQRDLLSKERLAALGQLAGGVAHQIRNPLGAIMNATSVLKRHLPPERHPHVDDAMRVINEEIRHADAIIRGLLDYARTRAVVRRPTSVVQLIELALSGGWVPPAITVELVSDDDIPLLHVDRDQIREVFVNLARNAVEAMPHGGSLRFEVRAAEESVDVAVSDTGLGILPEVAPHLFEPLRSSKPTGVGLGLVTARAFVEAHGGHLVLVSAAQGACFEVRLPRGEMGDRDTAL